jgi:hypothetical protein
VTRTTATMNPAVSHGCSEDPEQPHACPIPTASGTIPVAIVVMVVGGTAVVVVGGRFVVVVDVVVVVVGASFLASAGAVLLQAAARMAMAASPTHFRISRPYGSFLESADGVWAICAM